MNININGITSGVISLGSPLITTSMFDNFSIQRNTGARDPATSRR
jgi:hypothetical protein